MTSDHIYGPMAYSCPYCKAKPKEACKSAKSGGPTSSMHVGRVHQLCNARFIKQDVLGTASSRLTCGKLKNHRGRHVNVTGDLNWHKDFQVDIEQVLVDVEVARL